MVNTCMSTVKWGNTYIRLYSQLLTTFSLPLPMQKHSNKVGASINTQWIGILEKSLWARISIKALRHNNVCKMSHHKHNEPVSKKTRNVASYILRI